MRARKCQCDAARRLGDGPGILARARKQARATYQQRTFDRQRLQDGADLALTPIAEGAREEQVGAAKFIDHFTTSDHLNFDVERPEEKGTNTRIRDVKQVCGWWEMLCNGTEGLLMKAPRSMATVPLFSDMRHPAPIMPLPTKHAFCG